MATSTPAKSPSKRAQMASEAKAMSAELRNLVKTKDLTSKEVEFARQKLRRQYNAILFAENPKPSSAASSRLLDILNQLWMDTSHSFIHRYRQKVASVDKALGEQQQQSKQPQAPGLIKKGSTGEDQLGPTARRRLISTFRQFLSNEETFWAELLVRLIQTFGVVEAKGALEALRIPAQSSSVSERNNPSQNNAPTSASGSSSELMRQQALLLCHRTLICFGDLARYRELYNDSDGAVESKGKSGRTKNFGKAAECYHQARLLVPDNGNPSNQLAVLASYTHDTLSSMYHYYRALCVMQEFPTARPNLELTFTKALSKGKPDLAPNPIQVDSGAFQTEFVILHAHIFLQHATTEIEMQSEKTMSLFSTCLRDRLLASEAILKVICTCIAALFDVRMQGTNKKKKRSVNAEEQPNMQDKAGEAIAQAEFEHCVLDVTLDCFHSLFLQAALALEGSASRRMIGGVGISSLDPALVRALPALRVTSKWLLGQAKTIEKIKGKGSEFWNTYTRFVTQLATSFSVSSLPVDSLSKASSLEENIDMAGFLPLSHSMPRPTASGASVDRSTTAQEEHLLRIADLLADAQLALINANNGLNVTDIQPEDSLADQRSSASERATYYADIYGQDAVDQTNAFENDEIGEDDLLNLAMRAHSMDMHPMQVEDDEEEIDGGEQVLYPYQQQQQNAAPLQAQKQPQSQLAQLTASDLLLQVLNGPGISGPQPATYQRSPSQSPRTGGSHPLVGSGVSSGHSGNVAVRSVSPAALPSVPLAPQIMSSSIGTINPAAASIWNSPSSQLPPPGYPNSFGGSIWNSVPNANATPASNGGSNAWQHPFGAPGAARSMTPSASAGFYG